MFRKTFHWAALLAPAVFALAFAPAAHAAAPPSVESEIIRLTNVERAKVGAPAVRANFSMSLTAEAYAAFMAKLDMLGHNLDGSDAGGRLTKAGYKWSSWGENIAFNYPDAASVVKGWMSDEGHRNNLLNPDFTEIGVGVQYNAKGQPYYDQVLAKPAP